MTKKEVLNLIKGNEELTAKTRLELLKDTESDLFKKIHDPEVPAEQVVNLTNSQKQTLENHALQTIENWAKG